jgi:hypothetical protein
MVNESNTLRLLGKFCFNSFYGDNGLLMKGFMLFVEFGMGGLLMLFVVLLDT